MTPTDDLPAPVRAMLPGLVALALVATRDVACSPDGWEMAWASRCLWGLDGGPLACASLDHSFRPPGVALLVGPLSLLLRPIVALGVLALASVSLCAVPLGELGRRLGGGVGRFAAVGLLVATPELAGWAMVPDARAPALLLTLSAWALVLRSSPRALFAAGLLMALGPLFRPEALAGAVALPAVAWALHRGHARAAAAGAGVGLLATMAAGWWASGTFIFASRVWEGWVLQLGELVPLAWAKQLLGLGIWAPPMRSVAMDAGGVAGWSLSSVDLSGSAAFLVDALGRGQGLVLWILAGLGLVRAAQSAHGRRVLVVLAGASVSQLAAVFLFQARNPALPLSNLLVPLAAGTVLTGFGVVVLTEAVPRRRRASVGAGLAVVAALIGVWSTPSARLLPGLELSDAGTQAVVALRELVEPGDVVVASFETGPVVIRAERAWTPWPGPWDPGPWRTARYGRRWAVLSVLDGGLPGPLPPGTSLAPHSLYRSGLGWVAVVEIVESVTTP